MKKYILAMIALSLFSRQVFAIPNGVYVGAEGGWGDLKQGTFVTSRLTTALHRLVPTISIKTLNMTFTDTGRGARVFMGYQFNPYLAAEVGYYYFNHLNVNLDMTATIAYLDQHGVYFPANLHSTINVQTDAFDLVAKGIYPFTTHFNVYAKLGVAVLRSQANVSVYTDTSIGQIALKADPSVHIAYPTFGLGMSYQFNQWVSADLSWNRIQAINPCPYPSIDFAGLAFMFSPNF